MASIEEHLVASETAPAPSEATSVTSVPATDIIHLVCHPNSLDNTIEQYVSDYLPGVAQYHLVKCVANVILPTTADYVYIGMSNNRTSMSASNLAIFEGGIHIACNDYNVRSKITEPIVSPFNASRQIMPQSSRFPMLRLVYEKTAGARLGLTFYINVVGARSQYATLASTSTQSAKGKAASSTAVTSP